MQIPQFSFRGRYYINQGYNDNQVNYPSGRHGGIDIQPYTDQGNIYPADIYPVFSGKTMTAENTDKDRGKGIRVRTELWDDFSAYLIKNNLTPGKYIEFLYWHCLEVTDLDGHIDQATPIGKAGNTGDVWSSQFPGANGLQPVPSRYKGVTPYYGLHLHLECRLVDENGGILNLNKDIYGRIDPLLIINYPIKMTMGYKKASEATVYVLVGTTLVAVADWNAFVTLGGSEQSIVTLAENEFTKFNLGAGTLFKSNL